MAMIVRMMLSRAWISGVGEEGVEICARGKGIKRINDYYHMKGGEERRRRLYKGRGEAGKEGEVAGSRKWRSERK